MVTEEVFENMDEEFSTIDELAPTFLKNPKVGEKIEFTCRGFKIIKEKEELEFSYEKNGKQKTASNALSNVNYGIQFHTTDKQIYWVSSWSVWGQLKAIGKKLGNTGLTNVELQTDHVADGMVEANRDKAWVVRAKINGEWKIINVLWKMNPEAQKKVKGKK